MADVLDAIVNLDAASSTQAAVACPHCGQEYFGLLPMHNLGKTTQCTNCGNEFRFAEPQAKIVEAGKDVPYVTCPHCGRGNHTFTLLAARGQLRKCEHCKKWFRVM